MASKNEYVIGETEGNLAVTDGPNDLDLWLSLRGTLRDVTFHTGSVPVRIPPFTDSATFFSVKVRLLEALDNATNHSAVTEEYRIEGFGNKEGHFFVAKGTFSIRPRRVGQFVLTPMH